MQQKMSQVRFIKDDSVIEQEETVNAEKIAAVLRR